MAKWRFNPREFLLSFRRNGWMCLDEMVQIIPRAIKVDNITYGLAWDEALTRLTAGTIKDKGTMPADIHKNWNLLSRKYLLAASPTRTSYFFSHVLQESDLFFSAIEKGNERYFRTMYEVITPEECEQDYLNKSSTAWKLHFVYIKGTKTLYELEAYKKHRPEVVKEKAKELGNTQPGDGNRFKGRGLIQLTGRANYSEYGQYRGIDFTTEKHNDLIAVVSYNTIDSALKYWVSKSYIKININRHTDNGFSKESCVLVTKAVNGGNTHLAIRFAYPGAKVLQMGHYPEDFPGPGLLANTEGFLSGQSTRDYLASGISDWIAVPARTAQLDQEDDAIQLNEYGVDFLWATQQDEIKREKIRGKDWTGYLWTRRTEPTRKEMGDAAPKRPQRCFIALIGNQKNSLEFATCLARDRNPRAPNELHYRDFMRSLKSIEFGH